MTFYVCDEYDSPKMKGHAEVKLIYSLSKSKSSINNLIDKVLKCNQSEYPVEGWFFLIWNSYNKYTADDFFSVVKDEIAQSFCHAHQKIGSSAFVTPEMVDFCDSETKWRGRNRSIKVKAIPFTLFSTEFNRSENDNITNRRGSSRKQELIQNTLYQIIALFPGGYFV